MKSRPGTGKVMSQNSANTKPASALPSLEEEAQQVLNELWREKALPFELHVGRITKGIGVYTLHFHDSRIRTTEVVLASGQSFQEMVRTSVLARVAKISGPLLNSRR